MKKKHFATYFKLSSKELMEEEHSCEVHKP